jgi:hypothetical protein
MKNILFFVVGALLPLVALAHEGHVHGPGETDAVQTGPVVLTDEAIKNLGVQTVEAGIAPLQRTIGMIGRIVGLPERLAKIAPRRRDASRDPREAGRSSHRQANQSCALSREPSEILR